MQQPYETLPGSDIEETSKRSPRRALLYTAGALTATLCVLAIVATNSPYASRQGSSFLESVASPVASPGNAPFFRIIASSSFDAGLQHGQLAKERIHGWFAGAEVQSVFAFVEGRGQKAFEQLKADNVAEFPDYVEEMRGIATGAGVTLDQVWVANMLNELEALMEIMGTPAVHCSNVYAVAEGGYSAGFAHGHNDDWSDAVKPYWYLMSVTYNSSTEEDKLGFQSCAGVTYPAALVGWAPSWNAHGVYSDQNSMVPRRSRAGGLACSFVQRRALCRAHNLDEAVTALSVPGWSDSASMNVVDVRGKRMANVELWEDRHNVVEVTEAMNNYSHFNEFKHLLTAQGQRIDDPKTFVRDPRQRRVDALPAPRSELDVMARLSDSQIFRPTATITTVIINGATGSLKVWCGVPSASNPPAYSWDILNFF